NRYQQSCPGRIWAGRGLFGIGGSIDSALAKMERRIRNQALSRSWLLVSPWNAVAAGRFRIRERAYFGKAAACHFADQSLGFARQISGFLVGAFPGRLFGSC